MAINSICAQLLSGHDATCEAPARRYFQQAVLIDKNDILPDYEISGPDGETCRYHVNFTLREGATGYRFMGPASGSTFRGYVDKTVGDLGFREYTHNVQILLTGASAEAKCILDSLDSGNYVAALQLTDGTVEIYGFGNGLSTGDYTYDLQDGGGGAAIVLSSLDVAPESRLPLIYESAEPGNETADFDSLFSNVVDEGAAA